MHSHSIAFVLACLVALSGLPISQAQEAEGRIAIVDVSKRVTAAHLAVLRDAGVKVIGRYYARCKQWDDKRMIDTGDEVSNILKHPGGFGMLSIYQYYNNNELKFHGKTTRTYYRKKPHKDCMPADMPAGKDAMEIVVTLPDQLADGTCAWRQVERCQEVAGPERTLQQEAEDDAGEAVRQAQDVIKQPKKTAIYFGIDFDLQLDKEDMVKRVVDYVTIVSRKLKQHDYQLGIYGSGSALRLLKGRMHVEGPFAGQKLIDFTWFNASPGHTNSADEYRKKDWDLLQTKTALRFPNNAIDDLVVDTNVQNHGRPDGYVGFWSKTTRYMVPEARTEAIFAERRFACDGQALIMAKGQTGMVPANGIYCGRRGDNDAKALDCDAAKGAAPDLRSRVCFGHVVRVGPTEGEYVKIDCDETGRFDYWTRRDSLSPSFAVRPDWVGNRTLRRATRRAATACAPG